MNDLMWEVTQLHSNTRDIEDNPITDVQMKCLKSSETGEITFFQVENFAKTNAASNLRVKEGLGLCSQNLGTLKEHSRQRCYQQDPTLRSRKT